MTSHMPTPLTIPDKAGRPIHIHRRPGGWKLTPYERDEIYQRFVEGFPDKEWTAKRARAWMKLEAKSTELSPGRVEAFIREAIQSEWKTIDRSWRWWVGCSLLAGARESAPKRRRR